MQIVVVENQEKGIEKTKEILYDKIDKKTFLILAGGQTPRSLYAKLAKEEILKPGAVGIIDERYGDPFHSNSNELMVKDSGLYDYFKKKDIPFFSMLAKGKTKEEEAKDYDKTLRDMFFTFPKSVLLLGLGADGHIASIFPNRKDFQNPLFHKDTEFRYVADVSDPKKYGDRITLTFSGISLIDDYIMFAFGKEKKKALKKMLEHGPLEELPARFLGQEASGRTVVITDQKM